MDEQTPRRRESDQPRGKLRKGMYILPSLFTTANIAAGFYAILQTVHGTSGEAWHLDFAAKAIGFAVLFDGLDGRIARMTHTASDFGRELDSLADVITFGVAPALLAWMWGFHLPGRPGKKYFVGMPIPAGAGVIAAIVHYSAGVPVISWWTAMSWLMMVVVVGYLMVSTWRFYSFKDIDFRSRRPFRLIVVIAVVVALIALFSRPALFVIAILYMASGVLWRLQWIFRRKAPPAPPVYREASHTP